MKIQEIENQFASAMAGKSMIVSEAIIADGKLHRVYVGGDKGTNFFHRIAEALPARC